MQIKRFIVGFLVGFIIAFFEVGCASTSVRYGPFAYSSTKEVHLTGVHYQRNADGSELFKADEIGGDPNNVNDNMSAFLLDAARLGLTGAGRPVTPQPTPIPVVPVSTAPPAEPVVKMSSIPAPPTSGEAAVTMTITDKPPKRGLTTAEVPMPAGLTPEQRVLYMLGVEVSQHADNMTPGPIKPLVPGKINPPKKGQ